ncbi:MAG: isoprenyl transferase [Candidatus Omnitrophica bacterium]|nr:isoprenyl transferase [Candidatus Omnitrophota bacterium]
MQIDHSKLPRHVAIIMDGNGRWAKKRGRPKIMGHIAGGKNVDEITEACRRLGIEALTLYAFSTENWKRPKKEVGALMNLLCDRLKKKYEKLKKNNIRLNAIGRLSELPDKVKKSLFDVMQKTAANDGMILTLALNYGGRSEITDAAKAIAVKVKEGEIAPEDITENTFAEFLYTKGLPEVDLMIRTSGEMRVSNFLLWQISYAELCVTKKLWPDFQKKDLEEAILDFQKRQRRYGG